MLWLSLIPLHVGWVSTSQTLYGAQIAGIREQQHGVSTGLNPYRALGYLWTLPALSTDNRGLGGGIAWAWDPTLCDSLLPLFRETLLWTALVECHDLHAAMHRAMASWSANHQYISFIDVTDECLTLHGKVTAECELIELWVTGRPVPDVDEAYGALEAGVLRV